VRGREPQTQSGSRTTASSGSTAVHSRLRCGSSKSPKAFRGRKDTHSSTKSEDPRSVCTNVAEAWRKRRYEAHFVSKLSDAETEAAETQTWVEFAIRCGYLTKYEAESLSEEYERLCSQLIVMIENPRDWTIHPSPRPRVPASPRQQEKEHRA